MPTKRTDGFTIVELLVTLFVAGILLMAGFQLFTVALKASATSSQQATMSTIAYNYLQQYGAMAASNCAALGEYPLGSGGTTINVAGVSNVKVMITVDCAGITANDVSRVNVTFTYGSPSQTLTMTKTVHTNSSTITKNLTAWWPMNSTAIGTNCSVSGVVITADGTNATSRSGTCVYDVSGNHLNGVESGGITQTTGADGTAGGALNFNGTNGFIVLPAMSSSIAGAGSGVTFSVWAKYAALNNFARLIELGNSTKATGTGGQNDTITLSDDTPSTKLYIGTANGTTASMGISSSSGEISVGSWHNYAATVTPSGSIIFYKDGTQTGTASSSAGYNTSVSRYSNFIGWSTWAAGDPSDNQTYSGSMEDMRIYSRVLTATEISAIYKAGVL